MAQVESDIDRLRIAHHWIVRELIIFRKEERMASQAVTDAVNALLSEISTIKEDFDAAFAKLQASGNTDADVLAALQPVSDALANLDTAAQNDPNPTTTPTA